MKAIRIPEPHELLIIQSMLNAIGQERRDLHSLSELRVITMDDGGMGSLVLLPTCVNADEKRKYGCILVEGKFYDDDGVVVCLAINLDDSNRLYELDVWKVDFSPVVSWPNPEEIMIDLS